MVLHACLREAVPRAAALAVAAALAPLALALAVAAGWLAVRHRSVRALWLAPITCLLLCFILVGVAAPVLVGPSAAATATSSGPASRQAGNASQTPALQSSWPDDALDALASLAFASQAMLPSLFIVQLFELVCIAHRERGVNFCYCVNFEEMSADSASSRMLRVRVGFYTVVAGLCTISIVATALLLDELHAAGGPITPEFTLCFRGAFAHILRPNEIAIAPDLLVPPVSTFVDFASLLSPLFFSLCSIYFGILFWRYGTHYSFTVFPTFFNPWTSLFLFALLLFVGMFITNDLLVQSVSFCIVAADCVYIGKLCAEEVLAHDTLEDFIRNKDSHLRARERNDHESEAHGMDDGHRPELHFSSARPPAEPLGSAKDLNVVDEYHVSQEYAKKGRTGSALDDSGDAAGQRKVGSLRVRSESNTGSEWSADSEAKSTGLRCNTDFIAFAAEPSWSALGSTAARGRRVEDASETCISHSPSHVSNLKRQDDCHHSTAGAQTRDVSALWGQTPEQADCKWKPDGQARRPSLGRQFPSSGTSTSTIRSEDEVLVAVRDSTFQDD
mmetsp:Transcript_18738/g.59798  ORF Transcript_18738/g.59798 Transcript_18738/m.59798 type:complete len:560 (-) Transcript_18738:824-2503(-)